MILPRLETEVKRGINRIGEEDIAKSYAYNQLIHHSLEAVIHVYLCNAAKGISGRSKLKEFCDHYGLKHFPYGTKFVDNGKQGDVRMGFSCSLKAIQRESIFIPKRLFYNKKDSDVMLFNIHQFGYFLSYDYVIGRDGVEKARQLVERQWAAQDLLNKDLMDRGIKFGRDLLKLKLFSYEESCKEEAPDKASAQPEHLTDLARKMIAYYSQIVGSVKLL